MDRGRGGGDRHPRRHRLCGHHRREDHDQPITGDALIEASAAAIAHAGGGRVTGSEVGDEEGYYEVEVTLTDGRQVDVHLDQAFRVLDATSDQERGGPSP